VQFWHDLDHLPIDVDACIRSWAILRAIGYSQRLFNDKDAREFITNEFGNNHVQAFDHCHHPAMRCDYFRMCYLFTRGGFYVDADEEYQGTRLDCLFQDNRMKIQPLCYDLKRGQMVSSDEFTAGKYCDNRIYYVNNNPIVAPARHPIIGMALERATDILLHSAASLDIQSTTGPGNLSASLVRHCIETNFSPATPDFLLLSNWDSLSVSKWPLSYRNDERNWRNWHPPKA